ncbi:hypothetical protein COO60DRAFT_1642284 [Scenedesmus sp. NREL 46B-D3]|nr:hypothetical protein COO60DRAFT_1642284 [Scenedesmus sp. NREL 46B-D3]
MLPAGALQRPAAAGALQGQQSVQQAEPGKGRRNGTFGLDSSSGADLELVDGYLQQLLPALAGARADTGSGEPHSISGLGLDRAALLGSGLQQHSINSLYRSLAARAGAFRKLVSAEVQQLRQLVAATPQLAPTLQLLVGPIAAAPQQALKAGRAAANSQALQQHQQQQQQVLAAAAAESVAAADDAGGRGGSSSLGPSAEDLVKDYAEAYASMKETMEVRLRHEQHRGNFLAGKVQQAEGSLRDCTAQLDAANRRISEQRAEAAQLQEQVAQLQADLAASHAAHLALQQHHTGAMQAAAQDKQEAEEQHRQTVETLQQDLTAAGGAAAALADSSRQVEALRLLYNEELSRASRLAVELSRATSAADKAAAAEDSWRRQLAKSDSRADNAEGMAGAMKATARQLEEQLAQETARLGETEGHACQLRLMLERSRLAAVEQRAKAQMVVVGLASKLQSAQSQLSVTQRSLSSTEDTLKLRLMELEGANAQLQAGRSHLKQLMSDLEAEQERSAGLTGDLATARCAAEESAAQRVIAEGRLKTAQGQLSKANDSGAALSDKLQEAQAALEACTEGLDHLRHEHSEEQAAHAALRADAGALRRRLAELGGVEGQLAALQQQHQAAEAKLEQLEQEKLVSAALGSLAVPRVLDLTDKARQLQLAASELHQLKEGHASLQATTAALAQQLAFTGGALGEAQAAQQAAAAEALQLAERLEQAEWQKVQLMRQLSSATSAGDGAQQEAASLGSRLEAMQAALEAGETDRQALAAQRDGWMASFQEAYGKLQERTVSSEAASRRLASRAAAIQSAMQQLSSRVLEGNAAADGVAAGVAHRAGASSDGGSSGSGTAAAAAAGADADAVSAATASVLDQMAGLQQLMQAEAHKHQEVFDSALKGLSDKVQQRHQAAHAWWAEAMAASNSKRAARAAARANESQGLFILAAAGPAALQPAGDAIAAAAAVTAAAGTQNLNGKAVVEGAAGIAAGAGSSHAAGRRQVMRRRLLKCSTHRLTCDMSAVASTEKNTLYQHSIV